MHALHTSAAYLVTRGTGVYVGQMCFVKFVCTCTEGVYRSCGDARPALLAAQCVRTLSFATPVGIMGG